MVSDADPRGFAARAARYEQVELRLVDEDGLRGVPVGAVGEMIFAADRALGHGQRLSRSERGDRFVVAKRLGSCRQCVRKNEEGYFFFVDRIKDAIRRRGRGNISSFEVEAEVTAFPAVQESAVVAVPSELGEDDVLAVVAPAPGHTIDPVALIGVSARPPCLLHDPTLHPGTAEIAQDAVVEGFKDRVTRRRRHRRYVGP
jgi:crotonobetaine/carnitine-CoA ligase